MAPEARGLPTRPYLLATLALVLIAAFLRLFGLQEQILLDDEWHALNVVQNQGYAHIFSHFGQADHSIPVTLWYEWLTRHGGLDEARMRISSYLPALALLLVFPRLLGGWLDRRERLILLALMVLSPFLFYYARFARPYSLLALLVSASLPLAWAWWYGGRYGERSRAGRRTARWSGAAWWLCIVLSAWINPVSMAMSTAPMAWFGIDALVHMVRGPRRPHDRSWQPLGRLALFGTTVAAMVAALLWAPMANDFKSLSMKSAIHHPDAATAWGILSLWSGSGHDVLVAAFTALVAVGVWILAQRDRAFAAYLGLITVLAIGAVWLTGAEWSQHALVTGRYLIGLLPFFLAFAALGLAALARGLQARLRLPMPLTVVAVLALLTLTGPLPRWGIPGSQFVHHSENYFDYKPTRNPISELFLDYRSADFYAEIRELHPQGDALVIETYFHVETYYNPLHYHQQAHGQRVKIGMFSGLCAERVFGEIRPDAQGIELRNFVRLSDFLAAPGEVTNGRTAYLVLRSRPMMVAPEHAIRFEECRAAAEASLGPPWREAEGALVYRWLPANG
jgi:hypothetical protein